MAERFTTDNGSHEDVCLVDNVTGIEYTDNFEDIVVLMNELAEKLAICESREIALKEDHFTQMGGFSYERDPRGNYAIFSKNVIPKRSPVIKIMSPATCWNGEVKDLIWNIINGSES